MFKEETGIKESLPFYIYRGGFMKGYKDLCLPERKNLVKRDKCETKNQRRYAGKTYCGKEISKLGLHKGRFLVENAR